jgi:Fe2+ transport system protein FeoA
LLLIKFYSIFVEMNSKLLEKLIERYEALLPSTVYNDTDSFVWDNNFQRREIAKVLVAHAIQERMLELEMVRGENVYVYSSDGFHKPIDEKIKEIQDAVKAIKSM